VLRGAGPIPQPDPAALRLLWVDCELFPEPRGTLDEACRRMNQLFEAPHPIVDAAARRLRAGVRRHLLGEAREDVAVARYLEVFRRSPPAGPPRVALHLDGVERADSSSLELLSRLIDGPGAPGWPLLLSFEDAELTGSARTFFERLERSLPAEAFWSEPGSGGAATPRQPLPSLTPAALLVLRAAATVGERFESEILSKLLSMDELEVLGAVQEAVDRGLAITDRGRGVFRLDAELAERLRRGTLPSLVRAWHERLAQLFGGPPAQLFGDPPALFGGPPAQASGEPPARSPESWATPEDITLVSARPIPPPVATTEAAGTPPTVASGLLASPAAPTFVGLPAAAAVLPLEPVAPRAGSLNEAGSNEQRSAVHEPRPIANEPRPIANEPRPIANEPRPIANEPRPIANEQRAAAHAEAAGLWDTACEQHLAAAEQASLVGEHQRALQLAARALVLAEQLGDRERRRRLQILALLLVGRSRWQHQSLGEGSSLQAALDPLLRCRALVLESDPAHLRAELGSLIANVQYDIGTPEALEGALQELTRAGQLLLDAGQSLDAARLLNDEAAIWVKIGDLVRANHLLSRSREVFSRVADSYPEARIELLETEHLLARLLLHAPPRPGRERDALQLGIEHGRAAEEGYRALNERRQLGRVWETLGRLELRLDHLDVAARLLDDARQLQRQLGDGVGLARSSGASCELLMRARDYPRALERLAESIEFNAETGSRAGLEVNLESLKGIEQELPVTLHGAARALEQRLGQELRG